MPVKETKARPVLKEILRVLLFSAVIPFGTSLICVFLMLLTESRLISLILLPILSAGAFLLFRKALRPYIFWVKLGTAFAILFVMTLLLLLGKGNPDGRVFFYGAPFLEITYLPMQLFSLMENAMKVLFVIIGAELAGALMTALILKMKPGAGLMIGLGAAAAVLLLTFGIRYATGPQFKYRGHGFDYMHGYSSTDFTDYTVYAEKSRLVTLPEPASLTVLREEDMPVLDGAEACYPVYAALAKAVYQNIGEIERNAPERNSYMNGRIVCFTNTIQAFYRLLDGEVDMFFGAFPSQDQLDTAAYQGVELVLTPIGREGFVFFVEEDNPVTDLTSDELRGIYHGTYTNWAELGGRSEAIVAFQRPANSGSQTRMLSFMGDVSLKEPVSYEMAYAMMGVIDEVAQYHNEAGAIGYSFRYFLAGLNQEKHVRMLSVDGVAPTPETIGDGSYPLTGTLYLITRKDDPNPYVQKMTEFILSEQGQYIIEQTGYGRVGR